MRTEAALKIQSRAPTRIDFAGGTVDIWPIFLLLERSATLNLGIDLFAETTLEWSPGSPGIRLEASDQGHSLDLPWEALGELKVVPQLELHLKLLRRMEALRSARCGTDHRNGKLTLRTSAKSPAGAGLGGSSTLSISMLGALSAWEHGLLDAAPSFDRLPGTVDREILVETARDIETTVIHVPAGMQDYYGAAFGGLQLLRWGVGRPRRETLNEAPHALEEVSKRTLLFYSGQSRNSGINNWSLYQGFINKDAEVRRRFQEIVSATQRLWDSWSAGQWAEGARAIRDEWSARRGLAPGITTPEIDEAFRIGARHGIEAGKICGAGGGGCFFLFSDDADPARLARARAEIAELPGIRSLPFQCAPQGLEVSGHRA